jgi:hypothetical protein
MEKANAGLMLASEVAKTKGGKKIIDSGATSVSNTLQTANRVQAVIGWTITALVLAGGGFLIWRFLIKPSMNNSQNNGENRASIKEGELVLKEYDKLGLNVDPTKNYKSMADTIQSAMNGWSEDDPKVGEQLMLLGNDAEWEALKIAWGGVDGKRHIDGGWIGGGDYSLTSAITTYLDDTYKRAVNSNFASKNMKTRI